MDVKDVMVKEIITVNPPTKIRDAVELMNKNQIGCLVVTRNACMHSLTSPIFLCACKSYLMEKREM